MNTDKLMTIEDDRLDDVAGGSVTGIVSGLIKLNAETGLDILSDSADRWANYLKGLEQIFFGGAGGKVVKK